MVRFAAILLTVATSAMAGEYAVLASGMRLRVDRHEERGASVVLYNGAGSTTLGAAEVAAFEPEEYVAPKPQLEAVKTAAAPAAPPAPPDPRALVDAAATKTAIPAKLLRSVVAAESAYQADAVSPKGAIGLMQLMPDTASRYGADPKDPVQNVAAGTAYFRDLLLKYNGDVALALAAYNAGPGAVQKYGTIPPYRETINYVNRIDRAYNKKTAQ